MSGLSLLLLKQLQNTEKALVNAWEGETEFWIGDLPEFFEINEFELLLLVALRHDHERTLLTLAARKGKNVLSYEDYESELKRVRDDYREKRWKEIEKQLDLVQLKGRSNSFKALDESMLVLSYLVNSYKHNEQGRPDKKLLRALGLPDSQHISRGKTVEQHPIRYVSLAEGGKVLQALGRYLSIDPVYSYCPVLEEFADRSESYLRRVEADGGFAKVEGFNPFRPEFFGH